MVLVLVYLRPVHTAATELLNRTETKRTSQFSLVQFCRGGVNMPLDTEFQNDISLPSSTYSKALYESAKNTLLA